MTFHPIPSIKSVGLKNFLDSKADIHNGLDYTHFVAFINNGVNITNIARAFNVSRPTAVYWLEIYHEEAKAK